MNQTSIILHAAIPVYLIIAIGIGLRRWGVLKKEDDAGIMNVSVHLFLGALILDNIIGNSALKEPKQVIDSIAFGFIATLAGTFLMYALCPLIGLKKGSGARTFAVATGLPNYGFMAIPLVAALFKDPRVMGVLFTHNLGVELAFWTFSVALLSGNLRFSWRMFLKGPIIALLLGLALNFSSLDTHVPVVAAKTLRALGACAIPVSLLIIGTTMSDLLGSFRLEWRISLWALLGRLVLLPALLLAAALTLPISRELQLVIVIQAAMPAAVAPIMLSKKYGGQPMVATEVAIMTSAVALVTTPLVIGLGLNWLG